MLSPIATALPHTVQRTRYRAVQALGAWLLWLLFWPLASWAAPVNYVTRHWDMHDGLPHNQVHAVAQDTRGYIWAATWEGLVRYNGRHFTVFDNANTDGVKLNGVFAVLGEADGSVLVGTAFDGLIRYADGRWETVGHESSRRLRVDNLLRTADGHLWVTSRERLLRMDADQRLVDVGTELGLDASHIHSLYEHDGDLLLSTARGAWRLHDGQISHWGSEAGFSGKPVRQIISDGAGGWMVACDDGLWRWSGQGSATRVSDQVRVVSILRDTQGNLWSSHTNGEVLRQGTDGSQLRLQLGGMASRALFQDREGLIWLGNTDGLYQLAPGAVQMHDRASGLADDYLRAVMQTADGWTWLGHGNGLERWRDDQRQQVPVPGPSGSSLTVTALASDGSAGGIWAGSYEQGLLHYNAGGQLLEQRHVRVDSQRSLMVRTVLPTVHGLLVGTPVGLVRVHRDYAERYGQQLGLPEDSVQVLSQGPDGRIWIGTEAGMAILDPQGRVTHYPPQAQLPAQSVFDFHHDPDGSVWVATDAGLVRLRDGRMTRYGYAAGLPREKIFRILDDGRGHFWLSGNRLVFRVARGALEAYDRYPHRQLAVDVVDDSDGMPGSQINGATWPAGWQHTDGRLMFPTARGLALVDPELAGRDRQLPPQLVFEQVMVNGERLPLQASYRFTAPTNRLVVSYVALALANPHKLRYRYRLEGFDQGWIDADETTEAVYTNLPPGSYRFQVQAMALPLQWERTAAVATAMLEVDQVPAWWQRPRAFAALAVCALVVLGLWTWLRGLRYRSRQRRLNALVEERTAELHRQNVALAEASIEREHLLARLAHQALHDPLTDLPNRRAADDYLQRALSAVEAGGALSVALIDVDHFKQVNDQHGHDVGDQLLSQVGALLAQHSGGDVFAARQGGEEFLVVIQGLAHDEAMERMQSLCRAVADSRFPDLPGCTVSIGMASWQPGQDSARTLLAAADANLYRAKREGRNRVIG